MGLKDPMQVVGGIYEPVPCGSVPKDYDYLLQSDADAAKEKMKGLPET